MPTWQVILIFWVVLWALQSVGTWFQTQRYFGKLRDLQANYSNGYLGTGHKARKLGAGSIVMVVADIDLKVVRVVRMKGMTIFAQFVDLPEYQGLSLSELQARIATEPEKSSFRAAATSAIDQILRVTREGVVASGQPQKMAHA